MCRSGKALCGTMRPALGHDESLGGVTCTERGPSVHSRPRGLARQSVRKAERGSLQKLGNKTPQRAVRLATPVSPCTDTIEAKAISETVCEFSENVLSFLWNMAIVCNLNVIVIRVFQIL